MLLRCAVLRVVDTIDELSREVQKLTLRYDHCVNDSKYHPSLAKKHVLGWSGRAALNTKTIMLHGAISDCARLHTTFNLAPPLQADPMFKEVLDSASTILGNSRRAIVVIAGLNVVLELRGGDQVAKATLGYARAH